MLGFSVFLRASQIDSTALTTVRHQLPHLLRGSYPFVRVRLLIGWLVLSAGLLYITHSLITAWEEAHSEGALSQSGFIIGDYYQGSLESPQGPSYL